MRVATFNLLHGRTPADGHVHADRLREAVQSLDADVLGIQEVDRDQERSHGVDQTELVAEAMGAVAHRFVAAIDGTPGERWVPAPDDLVRGRPAYGIALLSRHPVKEWRVVRLPGLRVRSPIRTLDGRLVLVKDEPRVAVVAVVELPTGPLTVATTHLSFVPGWNAVQLRRLVAALRELPGPQLLTGDLNIPGRLPRAVAGWRPLVTAKTFPVAEPRVQLDHVLAFGDLPEPAGAGAPRLPLSDHRAAYVDLDL
ncbi:MAG TPA: endonuclease/exonuclease/phosphatase family protein [Mycobacteriales bacterium]|nr:endonuclease/exonuclease/phosphatase family protein [Mycobacteriales bacterium]